MYQDRFRILLTVIAACVATLSCSIARGGGLSRVSRQADAEQLAREQKIIQASGVEKWPKSDRLTVAPAINRSFLSRVDLITDEQMSFDIIGLDEEDCGVLHLIWRSMEKSGAALPAELPAEMQEALDKATEGMPDADRKRRYDQALDRYRKSKAVIEKGAIDVKVVVAGSQSAAHEWLVFESTQCALPTSLIVEQFADKRKAENLGDIAFKGNGSVRMVRGNVAVIIRGRGNCTQEVEKLAARIDAAIANEAAVADLNTMRPNVTMGAARESAVAADQKALPINVTAPGGQKVASIKSTANGTPMPVKDDEILLGSEEGQLNLKVSVITDRLMVTSVTTNAFVDGK